MSDLFQDWFGLPAADTAGSASDADRATSHTPTSGTVVAPFDRLLPVDRWALGTGLGLRSNLTRRALGLTDLTRDDPLAGASGSGLGPNGHASATGSDRLGDLGAGYEIFPGWHASPRADLKDLGLEALANAGAAEGAHRPSGAVPVSAATLKIDQSRAEGGRDAAEQVRAMKQLRRDRERRKSALDHPLKGSSGTTLGIGTAETVRNEQRPRSSAGRVAPPKPPTPPPPLETLRNRTTGAQGVFGIKFETPVAKLSGPKGPKPTKADWAEADPLRRHAKAQAQSRGETDNTESDRRLTSVSGPAQSLTAAQWREIGGRLLTARDRIKQTSIQAEREHGDDAVAHNRKVEEAARNEDAKLAGNTEHATVLSATGAARKYQRNRETAEAHDVFDTLLGMAGQSRTKADKARRHGDVFTADARDTTTRALQTAADRWQQDKAKDGIVLVRSGGDDGGEDGSGEVGGASDRRSDGDRKPEGKDAESSRKSASDRSNFGKSYRQHQAKQAQSVARILRRITGNKAYDGFAAKIENSGRRYHAMHSRFATAIVPDNGSNVWVLEQGLRTIGRRRMGRVVNDPTDPTGRRFIVLDMRTGKPQSDESGQPVIVTLDHARAAGEEYQRRAHDWTEFNKGDLAPPKTRSDGRLKAFFEASFMLSDAEFRKQATAIGLDPEKALLFRKLLAGHGADPAVRDQAQKMFGAYPAYSLLQAHLSKTAAGQDFQSRYRAIRSLIPMARRDYTPNPLAEYIHDLAPMNGRAWREVGRGVRDLFASRSVFREKGWLRNSLEFFPLNSEARPIGGKKSFVTYRGEEGEPVQIQRTAIHGASGRPQRVSLPPPDDVDYVRMHRDGTKTFHRKDGTEQKFDDYGPVFNSKANVRLKNSLLTNKSNRSETGLRDAHRKAAYNVLYQRTDVELRRSGLTPAEIRQLSETRRIRGYIWHHNPRTGVLELVDTKIHKRSSHVGLKVFARFPKKASGRSKKK